MLTVIFTILQPVLFTLLGTTFVGLLATGCCIGKCRQISLRMSHLRSFASQLLAKSSIKRISRKNIFFEYKKIARECFPKIFYVTYCKKLWSIKRYNTLKYVRIQITLFIANTRRYLQSDWLIEVQYWPYLYSGVGKK